jgi:hypothetical protein
MNEREQDQKIPQQSNDEKPKQKKPYKKPTFRYEYVFETMALACGKISTTEATCRHTKVS